MTHVSIQNTDTGTVPKYREMFGKPVVFDECRYEGTVESSWGNITGEEMVKQFWNGFARGGYVGHGETYVILRYCGGQKGETSMVVAQNDNVA